MQSLCIFLFTLTFGQNHLKRNSNVNWRFFPFLKFLFGASFFNSEMVSSFSPSKVMFSTRLGCILEPKMVFRSAINLYYANIDIKFRPSWNTRQKQFKSRTRSLKTLLRHQKKTSSNRISDNILPKESTFSGSFQRIRLIFPRKQKHTFAFCLCKLTLQKFQLRTPFDDQ